MTNEELDRAIQTTHRMIGETVKDRRETLIRHLETLLEIQRRRAEQEPSVQLTE